MMSNMFNDILSKIALYKCKFSIIQNRTYIKTEVHMY